MQSQTNPSESALVVACLCATWCGTCGTYQSAFLQLERQFPEVRFLWIDIEDEADLVDPIEVENFPTLLIASGLTPLFFGTLTPHIETLQRLITSCAEGTAPPASSVSGIHGLAQRLQNFSSKKGL
jgi:thiol-disulfide isomerase/thioredoxin